METKFTYAESDPEQVEKLSKEINCHPIVASLLYSRGIQTLEAANFFLDPTFEQLKNPFSLMDMNKAVKRIHTAVSNKEKILIFGDFDADGVTATSLLDDFFTHIDADVTWYIPHRIKEGYSLHPPHIDTAVQMSIDLIITVDCGVSSIEAVKTALLEDIDVIITDHHEPGETLPQALAVINPKRSDCPSGLDYLAGVGVAFYLVMALRKYFRDKDVWKEIDEPSLLRYLDLFALGTIGDMVPLIGDNRVLCMTGLKQMRLGKRPGILSLAKACRIDHKQMDSDDISFKLVPRINAAGRISHGRICVSHLTSGNLYDAETTATLLDELNLKRQQIEKEIVLNIEHRISRDPSLLDHNLLILCDSRWNPSVLGIAASRLARKYVCPVILLSHSDELAIGSCRSINNINIHQALVENAHLLERFGGHTMAAGLALKKENFDQLKAGITAHLKKQYTEVDFLKTFTIDAKLNFEDITFDLAKAINRLRPFGMENPEPIFLCENLKVVSSYIIGNLHRKMILQSSICPSQYCVEALHFNIGDTKNLPEHYDNIVFKLKINKFKPNTVQIIIQDF
ncbi:MAG: single-stranded-DNA-specific exonuclease RecJ [Desulfobacteraceae bacterium]|nr:single-stranded-DNA-specific exonuclease RecJ [Desulfobacteraceae bacterium]